MLAYHDADEEHHQEKEIAPGIFMSYLCDGNVIAFRLTTPVIGSLETLAQFSQDLLNSVPEERPVLLLYEGSTDLPLTPTMTWMGVRLFRAFCASGRDIYVAATNPDKLTQESLTLFGRGLIGVLSGGKVHFHNFTSRESAVLWLSSWL
ncbi:MAG: hypothetical protein SF029_03650 [bacterium]|nr:hypothetical protein [bacterium]